jgi:elongation factor G
MRPPVARRRVVTMAGDHGVTAEGVSLYPAEVTVQMVHNFVAGGAGINALARVSGARVHVVGGESRPRLDAEPAFTQAAATALRKALEAAEVDLLEPLMAFEVQTPAEFTSGIIADLNARKAEVGGVAVSGPLRLVTGAVPLSQMFGYSTAVRSLSQGRASFSMQPAGYRVVSPEELEARGLTWS